MRTNPQRAAYVAIKLAVTSYAIFHTGLAQARQDNLSKTLEQVTGRAAWFGSSALQSIESHSEVQAVITTQELSESGLRGFHTLRTEVAQ